MRIKKLIDLYKRESAEVFDNIPTTKINEFVDMVFEAYENEQTIFACGNGGNVASVQNLVVDMNMHPFVSEDKGAQTIPRNKFKCVSLCSDQASITGIGNDLGFRFIFSEQLKYQGVEGDIVFGMSGSGATCYGIFNSRKDANNFEKIVIRENSLKDYWIWSGGLLKKEI